MISQTRSNGELRALAASLADDLVARGLALGDVERLAPLMVDRVRLMPARAAEPAAAGDRAPRRVA